MLWRRHFKHRKQKMKKLFLAVMLCSTFCVANASADFLGIGKV